MSCSVGGYAVPTTLTCKGDPHIEWGIFGKSGEEKLTLIYRSSGPTLTFNVTQPGTYTIARTTNPLFSFLEMLQTQTVTFGPSADFSSAEQETISFKVEKQHGTAQASCSAPCLVVSIESGRAMLVIPIKENPQIKYAYIKQWEQSDAELVIAIGKDAVVLAALLVGGISPKPFGLSFAPSFIMGEVIVGVEHN
jgi:hypothetical protein